MLPSFFFKLAALVCLLLAVSPLSSAHNGETHSPSCVSITTSKFCGFFRGMSIQLPKNIDGKDIHDIAELDSYLSTNLATVFTSQYTCKDNSQVPVTAKYDAVRGSSNMVCYRLLSQDFQACSAQNTAVWSKTQCLSTVRLFDANMDVGAATACGAKGYLSGSKNSLSVCDAASDTTTSDGKTVLSLTPTEASGVISGATPGPTGNSGNNAALSVGPMDRILLLSLLFVVSMATMVTF